MRGCPHCQTPLNDSHFSAALHANEADATAEEWSHSCPTCGGSLSVAVATEDNESPDPARTVDSSSEHLMDQLAQAASSSTGDSEMDGESSVLQDSTYEDTDRFDSNVIGTQALEVVEQAAELVKQELQQDQSRSINETVEIPAAPPVIPPDSAGNSGPGLSGPATIDQAELKNVWGEVEAQSNPTVTLKWRLPEDRQPGILPDEFEMPAEKRSASDVAAIPEEQTPDSSTDIAEPAASKASETDSTDRQNSDEENQKTQPLETPVDGQSAPVAENTVGSATVDLSAGGSAFLPEDFPTSTDGKPPTPANNLTVAGDHNRTVDVDLSALANNAAAENDVFGTAELSAGPGANTVPGQPVDGNSQTDHFASWNDDDDASVATDDTQQSVNDEGSANFRSTQLSIQNRSLKPLETIAEGADYEIFKKLGEGGMGVVYAARQASIDRSVAVKMLKSVAATDQHLTSFVSEAVVTGELDHPNIVPIYDLGRDDEGALFYSMKHVQGTPWLDVIRQKSEADNIEILQRCADAIAFAHSRGVVHCDLKPENIMLGEFGEVLVMDWGLAQLMPEFGKPDTIAVSAGGGGTPAYMAPEMAEGRVERISPASDIYLLGAMLFEIITGKPPHTGQGVLQCLMAAAGNEIQPTEKTGELLDIAYTAMASQIEDRYATVQDFQAALRDYESHAQSRGLSDRAHGEVVRAAETADYQLFGQVLASYREALSLWPENSDAEEGLTAALYLYAECAFNKGDYDLALSLLDSVSDEHQELRNKVKAAQTERDARQHRLRRTKQLVAALGTLMLCGAVVAAVFINNARHEAEQQKVIAVEQADRAERQKKIADEQTVIATQEKLLADEERAKAEKSRDAAEQARSLAEAAKNAEAAQRKQADDARLAAEASQQAALKAQGEAVSAREREAYEAYVARIQLAAAKIDENAFQTARQLLEDCRPADGEQDLRGWEWSRLIHLCHQSLRTFTEAAPVEALDFHPTLARFVAGAWDGTARIYDLDSGQELRQLRHGGQYIHSVRYSPDGNWIATGSNDAAGTVQLWNAVTGQRVRILRGHADAVLDVRFSPDGTQLLSSSYDNTARLWDIASGREVQQFKGHFWWVWTAAFSPDASQIVTGSQDGTAIVWDTLTGKKLAEFTGHTGPVFSVEFTPDGRSVVSGGHDNRVLIWQPDSLPKVSLRKLARGGQRERVPFVALDGHTAGVRCVRLTADGRRVLSASDDNSVRIWNTETGRLLDTFRGHAGWVRTCDFSPDESTILTGSQDQTIRQWSTNGTEESRVLEGRILDGHADAVLSARFSPDGTQIVTASRDRTARSWDVATGRQLQHFQEGHSFLAMQAAFSPNGRLLFTSAFDNTVRIWNVDNGTESRRLEQTGREAALAVSHNGEWLITGGQKATAQIWHLNEVMNTDKPKSSLTLVGHKHPVTAVAFSADDRLVYTGDARGRGRVWLRDSGQLVHEFAGHSGAITAAVFAADGSTVLTASRDKTVGQWDLKTGEELRDRILAHPETVSSLAWLPNGRLVTGCEDGGVRIWNTQQTAEPVDEYTVPGRSKESVIRAVTVSKDGRFVAALDGTAGRVSVWDIATGRTWTPTGLSEDPQALFDLGQRKTSLWSVAFSPDGNALVTVGGNDVRMWNLRSRDSIMSFNPAGTVAAAAFSPDGRRVVTGSWDNSARIWDAGTGRTLLKLAGGHSDDVNAASFSPDGSLVLTAGDDGTVVIWEAFSGKIVRTLTGHEGRVHAAVFSADGRAIISGSADKTARVWNTNTGEQIAVLNGHRWAVHAVAISKDNRLIVTGSDDETARVWTLTEVPVPDQRPTFATVAELRGHTAGVLSVAISPDSKRVITASRDDSVKVWDPANGQELLTLKGHSQDITSAVFSPDGQHVLTGARDGTAILWLTGREE